MTDTAINHIFISEEAETNWGLQGHTVTTMAKGHAVNKYSNSIGSTQHTSEYKHQVTLQGVGAMVGLL